MASEKLNELIEQEQMAESAVRTCHMLMVGAADYGDEMLRAYNYAKDGVKAYEVLAKIRDEITTLKAIHSDVTKTISINLPDSEVLLKKKITLLKTLLKNKKITLEVYQHSMHKVKKEYYKLSLVA